MNAFKKKMEHRSQLRLVESDRRELQEPDKIVHVKIKKEVIEDDNGHRAQQQNQ